MIDGKVCNAVVGNKSSQVCYICGASPKEINHIDVIQKRQVDYSTFAFGLSTLHAWIRFFECILHVAYRRLDCKTAYLQIGSSLTSCAIGTTGSCRTSGKQNFELFTNRNASLEINAIPRKKLNDSKPRIFNFQFRDTIHNKIFRYAVLQSKRRYVSSLLTFSIMSNIS